MIEVVVVGMVMVVGGWSGDDRIEAEMYGAERRKSMERIWSVYSE